MYSQQEIDDAVASGAITPDAANALRSFVAGQRHSAPADDEQVRLITGFNDIFVAIAAAIMLFAVGAVGHWLGTATGFTVEPGRSSPTLLSPLLVAITAWGLALVFTARRRMALPSILLTFAFVGGVAVTVGFALASLLIGMGVLNGASQDPTIPALVGAASAACGLAAAAFHWRRFRVPVTVAAGAVAAAGILLAIVASIADGNDSAILLTVLALGIGIFLLAMRWDASDPSRLTRRSDVAFWLHLAAAPMIVHPIFNLLGLTEGAISAAGGVAAIALYVVLAVASLAIDRRALLVSALAYVLIALTKLFETLGAVELNVALTALVIGSGLLILSAYWQQARRAVVAMLPSGLAARLPAADPALRAIPAA